MIILTVSANNSGANLLFYSRQVVKSLQAQSHCLLFSEDEYHYFHLWGIERLWNFYMNTGLQWNQNLAPNSLAPESLVLTTPLSSHSHW